MTTGILGAVLVGGRSSRFGSDKAQALFGGASLCEHARAAIAPFVDRVVLVGGPDVPDLPGPHLGPLGGIAAALDLAAGIGFRCVLTIACDMPRVDPDLIAALIRRGPSYCRQAPVLGFWPSALGAQAMAHAGECEDRSVQHWARGIGAIPVDSAGPVANVNTPEDLLAL